MLETKASERYLHIYLGEGCLAINADSLREDLFAIIAGAEKPICFDFSGTRFVDAAGIGVLASMVYHARRQQKQICMCGVGSELWELMKATGFDRLLPPAQED